jgi:perosamine synthetase
MLKYFVSLYYSSIGVTQIFHYLYLQLLDLILLKSNLYILNRLIKQVHVQFPDSIVYPFSTGRGATSAVLRMAGIGKGDEVIISAFTCLAVPTAVLESGAVPIYVDINPNSLNTDVSSITKVISTKTKAIILQHTFGNPADVNNLIEKITRKEILIIEDCALSLGASIDGQYVGSFGDAAIFSMELSKTLSTGWGGILVINAAQKFQGHENWYENCTTKGLIQSIKDIIQTFISAICHKSRLYFFGKYVIYIFFRIKLFRYSNSTDESSLSFQKGFVFRMSKMMNRLAFIQWKRFKKVTEKCLENYADIRDYAISCGYTIPNQVSFRNKTVNIVSARVSFIIRNRSNFIFYFINRGYEVGLWFDGPLTPEPQHESFKYNRSHFPIASYIADHIVNLPCHSRMTEEELQGLKEAISSFARLFPEEINIHD